MRQQFAAAVPISPPTACLEERDGNVVANAAAEVAAEHVADARQIVADFQSAIQRETRCDRRFDELTEQRIVGAFAVRFATKCGGLGVGGAKQAMEGRH
jgi:hypothetical protein